MTIDWNKPLRFAKVQNDDHVTYQPKPIGSFRDNEGANRRVFVVRNWLPKPPSNQLYGFLVYDDAGALIGDHNSIASSGVFDATLVNGPLIKTETGVVGGQRIAIDFDGDKAMRVRFVK